MFKIIEIGKNPKRAKRKARRMKVRRIKRVKKLRKNPVRREKYYILYGLERYSARRFRLWYFTGTGFSRDRDNAKRMSEGAAKMEAKALLPRVPQAIIQVAMEKA